jgi:hypothetical protein
MILEFRWRPSGHPALSCPGLHCPFKYTYNWLPPRGNLRCTCTDPHFCYFPRGVLHRGWQPCSSLEQPRGTPLFRSCCAAVTGQDPCLSLDHVTVAAPALNPPSSSQFSGICRRNQVGKTLIVRHHPGAMPIGLKAPKLNWARCLFPSLRAVRAHDAGNDRLRTRP